MFSLRASGTSFNPEIRERQGDALLVWITIFPGNDEVEFLSLRANDCDIAMAVEHYETMPDFILPVSVFAPGDFCHESLPVHWIVPPAAQSCEELRYCIFIRPKKGLTRVKFTLSGGWLNQLTATRSLSAFE